MIPLSLRAKLLLFGMALLSASRDIRAGNHDIDVKPGSADDVGALQASCIRMSAAIRRKVSELTRSQALQRRELVQAWRAAKTAFAPVAQATRALRFKTARVALVQQSPPDLILLDVMMPEMDGYAVCELLKSGSAGRDIPLIFVTAKNHPQSESRALEAGAVDFIRKPINRAVVRARVRLQLELKGRERALQQLCGTRRHRCDAHPRPQRRPRRRAGCRPRQVGISGQHEP